MAVGNTEPSDTTTPQPIPLTPSLPDTPPAAPNATALTLPLPALVTAAPSAATPAPRYPLAPPLPPAPPVRTKAQALELLAGLGQGHVALWFQDQPEPLILPRAAATTQIQAARSDQLIILPLPGAAPTRWQSTIDQATQALRLAHWLAVPAPPPPPPAPDSAAARAAREALHRNIYQLLLGDPAATSQPK